MAIVKAKGEDIEIKPTKENSIDNQLEFSKQLSEVKSEINKYINTDFVLAKLGDKDKEAVREIMANAYYSQRVLKEMKIKAGRNKWTWKKKECKWECNGLNKKEEEILEKGIMNLMDTLTVRLQVVAVTNRNVSNNYLIRLLLGNIEEKAEQEAEQAKEGKIKETISKLMRREED